MSTNTGVFLLSLLLTVFVVLILSGCAGTTSPQVVECPTLPPAPVALMEKPAALVLLKPRSDGSASYADALESVTTNYAICHKANARVIGWQEFYEGVRRLHEH